MWRNCRYCGELFDAKGNSAFCCQEHRELAKQTNWVYAVCPVCGESFRKLSERHTYCSKKCGTIGRKTKGEFTRLSVYLYHKWTAEGMSVGEIAKLVRASPDKVERLLQIPLTEDENYNLRRFFNRRLR